MASRRDINIYNTKNNSLHIRSPVLYSSVDLIPRYAGMEIYETSNASNGEGNRKFIFLMHNISIILCIPNYNYIFLHSQLLHLQVLQSHELSQLSHSQPPRRRNTK